MEAKEVKGKLFILTNENVETINSLKTLVGNRRIKKEKVNKIVKAISEGCYIPTILVDEDTLQVIEGNHRIAAMKECIGKQIKFEVRMEFYKFRNPLEIARLINNTGSKWAKNEKLYSFCIEGKKAYLDLRTLMDAHPFICKSKIQNSDEVEYVGNYNITPTLNCVAKGRAAATMDSTFSSGTLKIDTDQLAYGERVLTEFEQMQKLIPNSCIFRKESVIAWCRVRASLRSFDDYLQAFKKAAPKWVEPAQRIADWQDAFSVIAMNSIRYEI